MKAGASFPSVVVYYDGETYWLVDGYHRLEAVKKLKRKTIDCEIHEGTLEDAQWHSYKANSEHGLRRSNDDKKKAVKAALQHPAAAEMSDREIAIHVGVSNRMVSTYRKELNGTVKVSQSEASTDHDEHPPIAGKIDKCKPKENVYEDDDVYAEEDVEEDADEDADEDKDGKTSVRKANKEIKNGRPLSSPSPKRNIPTLANS